MWQSRGMVIMELINWCFVTAIYWYFLLCFVPFWNLFFNFKCMWPHQRLLQIILREMALTLLFCFSIFDIPMFPNSYSICCDTSTLGKGHWAQFCASGYLLVQSEKTLEIIGVDDQHRLINYLYITSHPPQSNNNKRHNSKCQGFKLG